MDETMVLHVAVWRRRLPTENMRVWKRRRTTKAEVERLRHFLKKVEQSAARIRYKMR